MNKLSKHSTLGLILLTAGTGIAITACSGDDDAADDDANMAGTMSGMSGSGGTSAGLGGMSGGLGGTGGTTGGSAGGGVGGTGGDMGGTGGMCDLTIAALSVFSRSDTEEPWDDNDFSDILLEQPCEAVLTATWPHEEGWENADPSEANLEPTHFTLDNSYSTDLTGKQLNLTIELTDDMLGPNATDAGYVVSLVSVSTYDRIVDPVPMAGAGGIAGAGGDAAGAGGAAAGAGGAAAGAGGVAAGAGGVAAGAGGVAAGAGGAAAGAGGVDMPPDNGQGACPSSSVGGAGGTGGTSALGGNAGMGGTAGMSGAGGMSGTAGMSGTGGAGGMSGAGGKGGGGKGGTAGAGGVSAGAGGLAAGAGGLVAGAGGLLTAGAGGVEAGAGGLAAGNGGVGGEMPMVTTGYSEAVSPPEDQRTLYRVGDRAVLSFALPNKTAEVDSYDPTRVIKINIRIHTLFEGCITPAPVYDYLSSKFTITNFSVSDAE